MELPNFKLIYQKASPEESALDEQSLREVSEIFPEGKTI